MLGSKVWTVEGPTFYIFEPLKAHTYEPNISLIRLVSIMQNPDYSLSFKWIFLLKKNH